MVGVPSRTRWIEAASVEPCPRGVASGTEIAAAAAADLGQLADERNRVSDPDAKVAGLGGALGAHVDIEVGGRHWLCLLQTGLEMSGLGADQAEVAVDPDAPAQEERVGDTAEAV